ncbi:hypothetical protein INT45_005569, partial [Circinella minor]
MSLVGNYYGSSDSESSDIEDSTPTTKPVTTTKTIESNSKLNNGSGLGSLLPPPKNNQSTTTSSSSASSSSSLKKSVFYVDLPTGTQDSDDEEEQEKRAKRQKLQAAATTASGSGAKGLAALLPPPKRSFNFTKPKMNSGNNSTVTPPASSSSSSLSIKTARPSNISNSKPITESKAENDKELNIDFKTPIVKEDESDNEDVSYAGPFFRLGAELKTTPAVTKTSASTYTIPTRVTKEKGKATQSQQSQQQSQQEEEEQQQQQQQQSEPQQTAVDAYAYSDPNAMYSYGTDPSAYYQDYYQQQQEQQEYNPGQVSNTNESESSVFGDLDDTAITRLTGKRKGRDSQIQIKTVNQNDILPTKQDWKYNAQPVSTPKFVTNASQVQATGLQKKKNNIMSLISHAQSMQDRLDEQFASGRTAQNEARRKY